MTVRELIAGPGRLDPGLPVLVPGEGYNEGGHQDARRVSAPTLREETAPNGARYYGTDGEVGAPRLEAGGWSFRRLDVVVVGGEF